MTRAPHDGGSGMGILSGIGIGAALMYFLDPGRGPRRRAALRDQLVSTGNTLGDALGTTARDLGNRARGLAAETRSRLTPEDVTDEVLVGRVRAELGRVVSHPGSIIATASGGVVTVSGPVLAREVDGLLGAVRKVRGVQDVVNQLEIHERGDNVPGLQGGMRRSGHEFELRQQNWSPSARLLVGTLGSALAISGLQRRGGFGTALGVMGLALLSRSATNTEMRRLVGAGAGRRAVDIQKTISIGAPVHDVFEFFTSVENFPRFMRHVREVRDLGNDRSHWVVDGPAGVPVEWDAEVTQLDLDHVLAWKSVPGSVVESAGTIRFESMDSEATRVHIRMSYNPPAGAVGHVVSKLFARDPRTQMEEDLVRVKTFLETGIAAHDAAQPARGA